MVQKLRDAKGERDDLYTLEGMIEADQGYFSLEASTIEQHAQKTGRGSVTKSNGMVMAQSTVIEDIETGQTDRQCRYFKTKVLEYHQAEGADRVLKKAIDNEKAIVFSDKSTSYIYLEDYVDMHITEKSNE